jgi:hypothetical protein
MESWNDQFLKWNPSDYQGISQLKIPFQNIWIPGLKLILKYNFENL